MKIGCFESVTKNVKRKHCVEVNNGKICPRIEYPNSIGVPKELTKFYKCDKNALRVIKTEKIWASHPLQFNDPFDCSLLQWRFGSTNQAEIEELKKNLKIIQCKIGLFCITDTSEADSDLFWGYYNNHEGFAINFNSNALSKVWGIPFKVEYCQYLIDQKIEIGADDFISDDKTVVLSKILRWTTLKKEKWAHENEWRFIFFDCNYSPQTKQGYKNTRLKKFKSGSINEIVLGFSFFRESLYLPNFKKLKNGYIFDLSGKDNKFKFNLIKLLKQKRYNVALIELSIEMKLEKREIDISEINNDLSTVTIFYKG